MPAVRIPLSWPYAERGNVTFSGARPTGTDSRRVNVIDESDGKVVYTLKRPGLATAFSNLSAGVGQGMTKFGGIIFAITSDSLQTVSAPPLSSTSGVAWNDEGQAPWAGRSAMQAVTLNGNIYLMGGVTGSTVLGDVWAFGINSPVWKQCTAGAPWQGRAFFNACVLNNRIFIMAGGTSSIVLNDVWSSDNGTDWIQEAATSSWTPRQGAMLVSTGTGMYLMGGKDISNAVLNDVWYSTDGRTWALVKANDPAGFFYQRKFGQCFWLNNKIYIVGGSAANDVAYNDSWSSSNGKVWTLLNGGPVFAAGGLYGAGYCVYNNKLWVVNGQRSETVTTINSTVYSSTDGITWTLVSLNGPNFPTGYSFGALVVCPTPSSISAGNYQTMFYMGGITQGGGYANHTYNGIIDTSVATTTNLAVTVAHQPFQFNSFVEGTLLAFKNQSDLFILQGQTVIKVVDTGYPTQTVPGLVVLDNFLLVMDSTGLLRWCTKDNPFQWPLLNALGADYEDDPGVAVIKYMNYVVAFGTYTLQVFYDTGAAPPAIPFAPYLNAAIKVGCAAAATLCAFGPNIAWVSQTKELNRQVMVMNGLQPTVISTPYIDKLLKGSNPATMKANVLSMPGHLFYVLKTGAIDTALVYDFSTQNWYEWQFTPRALLTPFVFSSYLADIDGTGLTYVMDTDENGLSNGKIYSLSPEYYNDFGVIFQVKLITRKVDADNNLRKFWNEITLIGDRNVGTPSISYSDDDYQTFSNPRTVNMNTALPSIYACGAARRRALMVLQADSNPMRWEALECVLQQGEG